MAVADDVESELARARAGVEWRIAVEVDPLVDPPVDKLDVVDAARGRLIERDWDLVVVLTDLPLRTNRRPLVAYASTVHAVGVLSLPALGAVSVRTRTRDTVLHLLARLVGADDLDDLGSPCGVRRADRLTRRLRQLAQDVAEDSDGVQLVARVVGGNARLLAGMIWANQPWRLAVGLSRALVAAVAAGVFALVTSDIWLLADRLEPARQGLLAVAAVAVTTTTLVVGAHLWERPQQPRAREQVLLFNLATTATVLIGVLALYASLFVVALLSASLLVSPGLLSETLGHPVGPAEYAELAWMTSSIATLGGALGAALESDEAVRRAAYTNRADELT